MCAVCQGPVYEITWTVTVQGPTGDRHEAQLCSPQCVSVWGVTVHLIRLGVEQEAAYLVGMRACVERERLFNVLKAAQEN